MSAQTITPDQFEDYVLQNTAPVVVDFYTQWCNPCKQYSNTFDKVSSQYEDVDFLKVDVEQDPNLARQYGIRSVPTTSAFKDGQLVKTVSGTLSETHLSDLTNQVRSEEE